MRLRPHHEGAKHHYGKKAIASALATTAGIVHTVYALDNPKSHLIRSKHGPLTHAAGISVGAFATGHYLGHYLAEKYPHA